jgi:hypothetical protein
MTVGQRALGGPLFVLRGPQFLEGGGSPRLPVDQGELGLSPSPKAHPGSGSVTLEPEQGELAANFCYLGMDMPSVRMS